MKNEESLGTAGKGCPSPYKKGKMIIVSAPSGSGKSTIVNWLMDEHPELNLYFSVSCTSRPPRGEERDGVEYFFLSPEEFREKVARGEFLEYEEVYENRFYGTLKEQVEKIHKYQVATREVFKAFLNKLITLLFSVMIFLVLQSHSFSEGCISWD